MRIGELAKRSLVPIRMLRYYEERGLLSPGRGANGYRDYRESDVTRAVLVSSLIRSGLPTRLIIPLLQDEPPGQPPATLDESPGAVDESLEGLFAAELARLDSKIACMNLSRTAVRKHLDRLRAPIPG
ncbi:MerR family transcriptional regulator [Micromonospora pisi]|uniref:MerR family transcriptional regulator n=1 Tax=Micromonospora pisi TaxID=589240 RepID=A0A495JVL2_9ACTN|nr:MerR family transcriptional regulator [Micromonospora pisi]RKR93086.1 MerR family transcriptional regulator [Micromonospora pisi]